MKIKHVDIEDFIKFLMEFELKGKESRMRTRFVRLLAEKHQSVMQENQDLIKTYSHLDEDGEPNKIERDGKMYYDLKEEFKAEYDREYFILMNEDFVIEQNEERKEMLLLVKDIVLNCDKTFSFNEALEYDAWCELVEQIEYED